jgi:hypothetical protein
VPIAQGGDQNFEIFVQWIQFMCILLGISKAQIARIARINKSTISPRVKPGKQWNFSQQTAVAVYAAWEEIAQAKNIQLPCGLRKAFFNSLGFATSEQIQTANEELQELIEAQAKNSDPKK